jgi:hypothetical protein
MGGTWRGVLESRIEYIRADEVVERELSEKEGRECYRRR